MQFLLLVTIQILIHCPSYQLFDDATQIFSTAETPLIVNVIPTLEEMREGLIAARDDSENDIANVVRVACQAGLLLIDKYSTFAQDCDIYLIAIGEILLLYIQYQLLKSSSYDTVMCPDRKLKWFKDHGRTARQIKDIEKMVVAKWNDSE